MHVYAGSRTPRIFHIQCLWKIRLRLNPPDCATCVGVSLHEITNSSSVLLQQRHWALAEWNYKLINSKTQRLLLSVERATRWHSYFYAGTAIINSRYSLHFRLSHWHTNLRFTFAYFFAKSGSHHARRHHRSQWRKAGANNSVCGPAQT
jgi:hypothetical protein